MRCLLSLLSFLLYCHNAFSQQHIPFTGNQANTWLETIQAYQDLLVFETTTLREFGLSDVGKPLHIFEIKRDPSSKKPVLLINNAIHPGEPCGVDASLMFARELLSGGDWADEILDRVDIAIIPMYNIGGALNRGCCSRANQNGPEEYGFRGNARNLDLNRDFIKCDSKNAQSFNLLFQQLDPHVFVDTHTTNGADYRYVMTLITTQPDKAGPVLNPFIREVLEPGIYSKMEASGFPMTPYVNTIGKTPETGIVDFLETPRFSTGYAALFNCIGFTTEAHMFKAYSERVEATYFFLRNMAQLMSVHQKELLEIKAKAREDVQSSLSLTIDWRVDSSEVESFAFKGFQAITENSELTGKERLRYDRNSPVDLDIEWYHHYKAAKEIELPTAYLIPQAWSEVIERINWNGLDMKTVMSDAVIPAETYYIEDFRSPKVPYEGHFLHSKTKATPVAIQQRVYAGDVVVFCNQPGNRYLAETLEPEGPDSFFSWNFFDSILQQKEWFSDYIFEEQAREILDQDPELKAKFLQMQEEEGFRDNHFAQLYFIYQNSPNYESTYNLYPVLRLNSNSLEMIKIK